MKSSVIKNLTTVNHLPHWVRADPSQERVLDAVGLTPVLDDCAGSILPGISVLTRRARYISFFCWARSRSRPGDPTDLHAWEVSLAHAEHRLHRVQKLKPTDCSFLGKNHIEENWNDGNALKQPSLITQTPGWLAYRPALVNAGLIAADKSFGLTDDGERLATFYRNQARPPRNLHGPWHPTACLSHIRNAERTALRQIIGVHGGGRWSCQATCSWKTRRDTIDLLLGPGTDQSAVDRLMAWCDRRRTLTVHGKRLVRAGAWSTLSFGLTTLLAAWVRHSTSQRQRLVKNLRSARRAHRISETREISLDAIVRLNADPSPLAITLQALRAALDALDFLEETREQHLRSLAREVVTGNDAGEALKQLTLRHETNKGPLAWTIPENLAGMPRRFVMPGMRIDAILSLIRDLGIPA